MYLKIGLFFLVLIVNAQAFSNIKIGYTFQHVSCVEQPEIEDWGQIGFQYHKIELTMMPFSKISPYFGLVLSGFPEKNIYYQVQEQLLSEDPSIQYEKIDLSISVASLGAGLTIGYLFKIHENIYFDIYNITGYNRYFVFHKNTITDWNNKITSEWGNIDKTACFDLEFGLRPVIRIKRWSICPGIGYKYSKFIAHHKLRDFTLNSNNPDLSPLKTTYLKDESAYKYDINGITISLNIAFSILQNGSRCPPEVR